MRRALSSFTLVASMLLAFNARAAEVARVGSHVFYSSFWISLHERLRHDATVAPTDTHDFSAAEAAAWNEAVEVYKREVAKRSPVGDKDLVEWTRALVRSGDARDVKGLPDPVASALRRAAPAYRAHDWPADDRASRFLIAYTCSFLRDAGPEIQAMVSRVYDVEWPKELHFEITPYAEPFGANTPEPTPDLFLTIMSSRDAGAQGFVTLELAFHEPLHHFDDRAQARLSAAAARTGARVPRGLSHAILFYTAGEATRRAYARRGIDYKTAAGEVLHRAFPDYVAPLETYWKATMDGKMTRDAALDQILLALKK